MSMQVRQPEALYVWLQIPNILIFCIGIALMVLGLSFDWAHLLTIVRFPPGELNNPWVRADLATLRGVCVVIATGLIISGIFLSKYPHVVAGVANKIDDFISTAAHSPLFIPLSLTTLVLMKTSYNLAYISSDMRRMAPTISRVHSAPTTGFIIGSLI